jgi:hypothetical protein
MWRQVGEAMKNASSISSRLDRAISRCNRLQEGPCGSTLCTLSQHFAGGGGWYTGTPWNRKGPQGPLLENVVGEATKRAPGEQSPGVLPIPS